MPLPPRLAVDLSKRAFVTAQPTPAGPPPAAPPADPTATPAPELMPVTVPAPPQAAPAPADPNATPGPPPGPIDPVTGRPAAGALPIPAPDNPHRPRTSADAYSKMSLLQLVKALKHRPGGLTSAGPRPGRGRRVRGRQKSDDGPGTLGSAVSVYGDRTNQATGSAVVKQMQQTEAKNPGHGQTVLNDQVKPFMSEQLDQALQSPLRRMSARVNGSTATTG